VADDAWGLAEAKAKLSEVIDKARIDGPQVITRNGKPAGVLVSPEEWARRVKPRESLADFLARSPLRGSGLEVERDRDPGRDVEF
jgi:prevent-host-death family protein